VAEVFKTALAASADPEHLAGIRNRFTYEWKFSTWTMDRVEAGRAASRDNRRPRDLPDLAVDGVLQVGAGAVGNAVVLGFESCKAVRGVLDLMDPKSVDIKNLNRCYYFTEKDVEVERAKVDVLSREAARPGFRISGVCAPFSSAATGGKTIVVSAVDNNEARHRIQEELPERLVEGATGDTTMSVSVHELDHGMSCLVCRHPDRSAGGANHVPLTVEEAAEVTGLSQSEIQSGEVNDSMEITEALIARVRKSSPEAAESLQEAMDVGIDLCGALGDIRSRFGTVNAPQEASVPFVSNLAGVLAAAEVVKLLVAEEEPDTPVLANVLELDLACDYARHDHVSYREPPRASCQFCQGRAEMIDAVLQRRRRSASRQTPSA